MSHSTAPKTPILNALRDVARRARELEAELPADGGLFFERLKVDPTFASAERALHDDADIGPRLGQNWSSVSGGMHPLRADEVIRWFVFNVRGDEPKVEGSYTFLMQVLGKLRGVVDVFVPIERLYSEEPSITIGSYQLREATPQERESYGRATTFVLTKEETIDFYVGEEPRERLQKAAIAFERRNVDEAGAVVDAVRLVTTGRLSAPWLSLSGRWPCGGGAGIPLSPFSIYPGATTLRREDIPRLIALFERLKIAERSLRTAARRFGISRNELNPDDRILDLMSAAEALYLPGEKTESTSKLSMRAAFFVRVPGYPRRAVFEVMKAAYAIRSRIAHGGDADGAKRPDLDGGTLGPHQFVELVDDLVQRGIVRALEEGLPKPNWDELLLAAPDN